jgi:hypothetical protein
MRLRNRIAIAPRRRDVTDMATATSGTRSLAFGSARLSRPKAPAATNIVPP